MSHQHKTNFVLKIIFLHTSTFSLGITKIKFSCLLENKVLSVFCKSNSIYTKNTLRNEPIITLIFEVLLSSTSILSNSTHFHCYVFINIYELFNMSSSKINHVLEFLKRVTWNIVVDHKSLRHAAKFDSKGTWSKWQLST